MSENTNYIGDVRVVDDPSLATNYIGDVRAYGVDEACDNYIGDVNGIEDPAESDNYIGDVRIVENISDATNYIGDVRSGSQLNYNPANDSDVDFYAKTLSGNTIVDSISDNDVSLQVPCLAFPNATADYAISDAGALDIGSQDFTMCGWVNDYTAAAGTYLGFFGKGVAGSLAGRYCFYTDTTTRYITMFAQSSGGVKVIASNIVSYTAGWKFLYMDVNQGTKIIRFFIDNVQIGVDTAFTGTFPSLAASPVKFRLHGLDNTLGVLTQPASFDASDIRVFHRLLSDAERLLLFQKGDIGNEAAYYPCTSRYAPDVSGNNLHPVILNPSLQTIKYHEKGSFAALQRGYDLWKSSTLEDVQIPLHYDGTSPTPNNLPVTYSKRSTHVKAGIHNFAASKLLFSGANFDRSNTTIFSDYARATGSKYVEATPKLWDISEIEILKFKTFLNTGYKGTMFCNVFGDREYLTELFTVATEKTNVDLRKALKYSNNYDAWHDIEYYFESKNIVMQRDNMAVYFDSQRYLRYSEDNAATYINEIDLNGVTDIIKFCYIYEDGSVLFGSHTKMYYSHDKLQTYTESTVLDVNGAPFVPTLYDNFSRISADRPTYVNNVEIPIWGTCSNTVQTSLVNTNLYASTDKGITVKVIKHWTNDLTHVHAVNQCPYDESYWVQTGDGAAGQNWSNWYKVTYNTNTDIFNIELIKTGNSGDWYKTTGMIFLDGYVYFISDNSTVAKYGVWRVLYEDIIDENKYEKVLLSNFNGTLSPLQIYNSAYDEQNIIITYLSNSKLLAISTDKGKSWFEHQIVGGPDLMANQYAGYLYGIQKNTNGYYCFAIAESGEHYTISWNLGTVLMLKIIKP